MPSRSPTLAEAVRLWIREDRAGLHTAIPCKVVRVDLSLCQVDVKPTVKAGFTDDDGDRQVEEFPVVVGVPIHFPGAGGMRITFPVAVDDEGLLIFSEVSVDSWAHSASGADVDPLDDRRHHAADGVAFLPGVHRFTAPWQGVDSGVITLGSDGGSADAVATDARVQSALSALKSAISSTIVVPNDGGASFKTTLLSALGSWPSSVGSATVKVTG